MIPGHLYLLTDSAVWFVPVFCAKSKHWCDQFAGYPDFIRRTVSFFALDWPTQHDKDNVLIECVMNDGRVGTLWLKGYEVDLVRRF